MEQEKLINLIKNEPELVENSRLQTGNILVCINTKDPEIKLDKLVHPDLMNKNDIKFGVNKGLTLENPKLIVCDIEKLDQINDQDIRWHEQQDGDEPLNVLQDWQKDNKHFVMVDDQKNRSIIYSIPNLIRYFKEFPNSLTFVLTKETRKKYFN